MQLEEVIDLHFAQQVVQAADLDSCKPFLSSCTAFNLPEDRKCLIRTTPAVCQLYGNDHRSLVDTSHALSTFKLLLFASAPAIMPINGWLSIGSGHPIQWIGTDPMRPL